MEIYTAQEAARILGVHYKTVMDYIHSGKLKTIDGGDGAPGKRGMEYMISSDVVNALKEELSTKVKRGRPTKQKSESLIDEKSVMKRIMQRNALTFKKVAEMTGYCYASVMHVMNGRAPVSKEFSKKFADAFGLDYHELDLWIKKGELPDVFEQLRAKTTCNTDYMPEKLTIEDVKTVTDEVDAISGLYPVTPIAATNPIDEFNVQFEQALLNARKTYYVITCYVTTREGLIFDNIGYNERRTNLGTKKIFKTKDTAEKYLVDVIKAKQGTNDSGCFYKVHVNETELIAYKTIYDICEVEVDD